MKQWRFVALALALCASVGCYRYSVGSIDAVPVGVEVRARLSPGEAALVSEVLGRDDRTIEGRLLERTDSGFIFAVRSMIEATGTRFNTAYQRIAVPRSAVVELELRRLDRVRTGALIGAGLVAGTAIAVGSFSALRGSEGQDKPTSERLRIPRVAIPLIRIPIGR